MIRRSIASVVDQALLSGLNFFIGIYLIANVPKESYGLYVQLFAAGVLICGTLDALIANAIANFKTRMDDEGVLVRTGKAQFLGRLLGGGLALLSGLLAYWLQPDATGLWDRYGLVLFFVIYVVALVFRDFKRVILYLSQQSVLALRLDILFLALAVAGGWGAHFYAKVSLPFVFAILAMANFLAAMLTPGAVKYQGRVGFSDVRDIFWECWAVTRWALPGLALGWLGNSMYLYAAGYLLGLEATAELGASRLLLMPVTLLMMAWQQMARPDIARLIQEGHRSAFFPFLGKSAGLILSLVMGYFFVAYLFFDYISTLLSTDKYEHFYGLLTIWSVYVMVYSIKFMGTIVMVGFGDFLTLLKMNMGSLALQAVLLFSLPSRFGIQAVVYCLIASEVLELVVIWGRLLPARLKTLKPSAVM